MVSVTKKNAKLAVYVEEYHNDVLYHIYRHIGAKKLPLCNNLLIHFDSHPDLSLPLDLTLTEAYDKRLLFDKLSIENWILPAVFTGIIRTIVWVKPLWSRQIKCGEYNFYVGLHAKLKTVFVTCTEEYFLSEGIYCYKENLDPNHTNPCRLIVTRMDDIHQIDTTSGSFILDIDLDYFSTKNPFLDLYPKADILNKLRKLYLPSMPATYSAVDISEERRYLLSKLKLEVADGSGANVKDIKDNIGQHYPCEEIDWWAIHQAGCTLDLQGDDLPYNISSKSEILELVKRMSDALIAFRMRPSIITVARSTTDDYCPPDQVEFIQEAVLSFIKQIFGESTTYIQFGYQKNVSH